MDYCLQVEQPAQSYVSVVQQTQAQAQPQQPMHAQKTPGNLHFYIKKYEIF